MPSHRHSHPSAPRQVLLLARHELRRALATRQTWWVLAGALLITSLLCMAVAIGPDARPSTRILEDIFYVGFGVTLTLSLILSMRAYAEGFASHTWQLVELSPRPMWQVMSAKLIAQICLLSLFFLASTPMPLLVWSQGNVSAGHLLAGYLGLLLLGMSALSIGAMCSSLTSRQALAAAMAALLSLALLLSWTLAPLLPAPLDAAAQGMSLFDANFRGFMQGRLTLSALTYYLTLTLLSQLVTWRALTARRWR